MGSVPVAVLANFLFGLEINVEIVCVPLSQTYEQWRQDTYDASQTSYAGMVQAYSDEKTGFSVQQRNPVDINSTDQNANTIKQELKRQVIEMLLGTQFCGRNAVSWTPISNPPTNNLTLAAAFAPEIQFLEQAFEWETLSYICYPYYW